MTDKKTMLISRQDFITKVLKGLGLLSLAQALNFCKEPNENDEPGGGGGGGGGGGSGSQTNDGRNNPNVHRDIVTQINTFFDKGYTPEQALTEIDKVNKKETRFDDATTFGKLSNFSGNFGLDSSGKVGRIQLDTDTAVTNNSNPASKTRKLDSGLEPQIYPNSRRFWSNVVRDEK